MNYEEILTSQLQQIITQHRSFNRFAKIEDEKVFMSERNQELIFHFAHENNSTEQDIKVKQSCYIRSGQANLKTKIYFWDMNAGKWVVTKKNIKYLENILDTIETFDNVVSPAKLEKLGQMLLFGEVI